MGNGEPRVLQLSLSLSLSLEILLGLGSEEGSFVSCRGRKVNMASPVTSVAVNLCSFSYSIPSVFFSPCYLSICLSLLSF